MNKYAWLKNQKIEVSIYLQDNMIWNYGTYYLVSPKTYSEIMASFALHEKKTNTRLGRLFYGSN